MTLIIKELVIRGHVIKDNSHDRAGEMDDENLKRYLSEMQKLIEKECVDKVLFKIERELKR